MILTKICIMIFADCSDYSDIHTFILINYTQTKTRHILNLIRKTLVTAFIHAGIQKIIVEIDN